METRNTLRAGVKCVFMTSARSAHPCQRLFLDLSTEGRGFLANKLQLWIPVFPGSRLRARQASCRRNKANLTDRGGGKVLGLGSKGRLASSWVEGAAASKVGANRKTRTDNLVKSVDREGLGFNAGPGRDFETKS